MSRNTAADHFMSVPIPTYEEAISRSSSSQRNLGPSEISHDSQRQHLLSGDSSLRQGNHRPARDSIDSDLSVPDMVDDEHHGRRELEELDYLEPGQGETIDRRQARRHRRARVRRKLAQQLSNLSATLGALRMPSLRRLYAAVPPSPDDTNEIQPGRTWRSRLSRYLYLPEQYRISVPTIARLFALLTIAGLVWFLFSMNLFPRRRGMMATMFEPESVRVFVQEHVDGSRIRTYLEHISSFAHEAGSVGDYYMADWMLDEWSAICELDEKSLLDYSIMADYPVEGGRSVKVTDPADEQWSASLEEDLLDESREQTLIWHAYSSNGKVEAPLIYANGGSRDDFQYLHTNNITTKGAIALLQVDTKHELQNVGLKIRFAQEAGCVGVLIFNGDILTKPDMPTWPDSLLPGDDSVHRANVALSNWVLGDPLTPGYASVKGSRKDRDSAARTLPTIPSIPLSWRDASVLLSKLNGRGSRVPATWLASGAYTGNGKDLIVEMRNENAMTDSQEIWQVHASIAGAESPRMKVIVGAPRDSWCYGGSHSASASAILTEIIGVFGELRKLGWRPLRSIEFVSWDANTFNAAGSTEYVEDKIDALRDDGVAYINVNSGISGSNLHATGSPMLQRVLKHALNRVALPNSTGTLRDAFDSDEASTVSPLAPTPSLTDSAPFTHIAGIPVLDMQFTGEQGSWVQGSCYDTFQWVQNLDSSDDWAMHKALAQVWALVILELVSTPLLPLDSKMYAEDIATKINSFETDLLDFVATHAPGQTANELGLDVGALHDAADILLEASASFHAFEDVWTNEVLAQGNMEDLYQNRQRNGWNGEIIKFEKALIDRQKHKDDGTEGGLKDRPQFRHILVAPEKWSDGVRSLPTIWDYLEDKQWEKAGHEISRIAGMIQAAAEPLSTGW